MHEQVTTHGLVDGSPLISQHPDWFIGGKWSMTDFNYESEEFVSWCVGTHTHTHTHTHARTHTHTHTHAHTRAHTHTQRER
eukprot:COSAG03_NODE_17681_length_370_cov_1.125461_1_plen_80_part_01